MTYRQSARQFLFPVDHTQTVEQVPRRPMGAGKPSRRACISTRLARAMGLDDFAPVLQFSGSSWSMANESTAASRKAYNEIVVFFNGSPESRGTALLWLKRWGLRGSLVVGVSARSGQEILEALRGPRQIRPICRFFWTDNGSGITIRAVPIRSALFGLHVIPPDAIVSRPPANPEDSGSAFAKYVGALDNASLPPASFEWLDANHIRIHTTLLRFRSRPSPCRWAITPGWHATANGQQRSIHKDGLGLMWLRPECQGRLHHRSHL